MCAHMGVLYVHVNVFVYVEYRILTANIRILKCIMLFYRSLIWHKLIHIWCGYYEDDETQLDLLMHRTFLFEWHPHT